jgi:hypothetical protein
MRLIDADALCGRYNSIIWDTTDDHETAINLLSNAPTAEPPRGEWIPSPNIMECVVCSRCNSDNLSAQVVDPPPPWYHFCPNCGAKMKGGEA